MEPGKTGQLSESHFDKRATLPLKPQTSAKTGMIPELILRLRDSLTVAATVVSMRRETSAIADWVMSSGAFRKESAVSSVMKRWIQ